MTSEGVTSNALIADTLSADAPGVLPPESLASDVNLLNGETISPDSKYPGPDMSVDEALRKRMSDLGRRPKSPRGLGKRRIGEKLSATLSSAAPKWMQQLLDEMDKMRRHPLLVDARKLLSAELKTAGVTPADELIEATARAKALCDLTDAALFNIQGGPVNRHKRQLHRLTEQRDERLAAYLSLRQRIGLDQAEISAPSPASLEHLADASMIEMSRRAQFTLGMMTNELRKVVDVELSPAGSSRLLLLVSERPDLWQRWLAGDWRGVLDTMARDPALSSQADLIFGRGVTIEAPSRDLCGSHGGEPVLDVPRSPPMSTTRADNLGASWHRSPPILPIEPAPAELSRPDPHAERRAADEPHRAGEVMHINPSEQRQGPSTNIVAITRRIR